MSSLAFTSSTTDIIEMAPPHVVARYMEQIRVSDGFSANKDADVDEKIIIDPQPDLPGKEKD